MDFEPFPKISRLSREMIITEKLDGTNAQIFIDDEHSVIMAGSRNRWLTKEADNYGFHKWVMENQEELVKLGPGRHYGEWWGRGIQRGYGLIERRFSLFNVGRWTEENTPSCVSIVPRLFTGLFSTHEIENTLAKLKLYGSQAAPGFMKPEGVVIFHTHSGALFKKTFEGDEVGKGV